MADSTMEMVRGVIEAGEPFTDADFPPCRQSLAHDWETVPSQELWEQFEWRRASEIYGPVGPVEDTPWPNDIKQGALGDCYLLGSASVLAENPKRVKDLFPFKKFNAAGIYVVRLLWKGKLEHVVLDDYFPYFPMAEAPAFAHPNKRPELWVMLIEKAYAKLNGSYQEIIAGSPAEALHCLTTAPTERFPAEDTDGLWERLLLAEKRGWPTMATTKNIPGLDAEKAVGLVEGHAYGILNAKEVESDGQVHQLILMRNPWGKVEWSGDWSDQSPLWTDELRQKLNFPVRKAKDDGKFWITMKDVTPFLQAFYINHHQPGWNFVCATDDTLPIGKEIAEPVCAIIEVKECERSDPWCDMWLTLQFHCESSKELPAIAIGLFRTSDEDGLFRPFAQSKYVKFTSVDLEIDAHPGVYLATLRVDPPDDMEPGDGAVTLNSYSEWPVNLKLAPDWPRIWSKLLPSIRAIALEQGTAQTYEKYGAPEIKVTSWQNASLGIACVLYENSGASQFQLQEDLGFQLSNLVLLKGEGEEPEPAEDQESYSLLLSPGESRMLMFRTQDVQKPFSLGYSKSFALQGA